MEKDVAILMADLTGYTAMTDVHGGASAARLVNKYMELVNQSISGDCKVAQRIGDQVVMISEKADDLVATALKLNAYTLAENHFLSIHAGLHFGPIHYENGNLFGSTINVASRIMNLARRGQILCSSTFILRRLSTINVASRIMNLARRGQILCSSTFVNIIGDDSFTFSPVGKFKLKNVMKEIEIFELGNLTESSHHVDPVCHMQVKEDAKKIYFRVVRTNVSFL